MGDAFIGKNKEGALLGPFAPFLYLFLAFHSSAEALWVIFMLTTL
jgi:hypothetical protein